MSRRRIFTIVALATTLVALTMTLYFYSEIRSGITDFHRLVEAEENESCVDSLTAEDGVPASFARLFATTYSIDTSGVDGSSLRADTSYRATGVSRHRGGRRVSISICGVDSRLGERVEHADANHVVTLWLDSGTVDIISIPRDTPSDAGMPRRGLNIVANVLARKGREAYLHEVATIAGLDSVEYFIKIGFSQARGLLELLGFGDNAGTTLRLLRSRQAFDAGDFQRSFNQGQFIRQMLLSQFDRLRGVGGSLLVRAGLGIVETNLTSEVIDSLCDAMQNAGFSKEKGAVSVVIMPEYYAKMAVYNFTDPVVLGGLLKKIDRTATNIGLARGASDPGMRDSVMGQFCGTINRLLDQAAIDSIKLPVRVIAHLRRPFEQRIWWQIADKAERSRIRRRLGTLLSNAYDKNRQPVEANHVRDIVGFEEEMAMQ